MTHYIIIGIIIAIIVLLQFITFIKTLRDMQSFQNTFSGENANQVYSLKKNRDNEVVGIDTTHDNMHFNRITTSLNEYLKSNASSTIDFQLIKDAVDRNCDSAEEDINTEIPIPLYLGLAGTMGGIIIGVGYMWLSGTLGKLLAVDPKLAEGGSEGIEVLLSGVGIAMLASIIGLTLTTISTYLFKGFKLNVEIGKNSFFTWMQANLLPEVSTDIAEAIARMSQKLERFNSEFVKNTRTFGETMKRVQDAYKIQTDLMTNIQKMNTQVENMANKNVMAAQKMEASASHVDRFSSYLLALDSYTKQLHEFVTLFSEEQNKIHALEEIKEFFQAEKETMAKRDRDMAAKVGKFDAAYSESINKMKNRFAENNTELEKQIARNREVFKQMLENQANLFKQAGDEMREAFKKQLQSMPEIAKSLEQLPIKMQTLTEAVNKGNNDTLKALREAIKAMPKVEKPVIKIEGGGGGTITGPSISPLMKWIVIIGIIVIVGLTGTNTWFMYKAMSSIQTATDPITENVTEQERAEISSKNAAQNTDATPQPSTSNPAPLPAQQVQN